jgi:parallel beta-helix repeat protein
LKHWLHFSFSLTALLLLAIYFSPAQTGTSATNSSEDYYVMINPDGTIEPNDGRVIKNGNTYYLTCNMHMVYIETKNITFNGQGFTLNRVDASRSENVTIKNVIVNGENVGISLYYCSNCTVTNCTTKNTSVLFPEMQGEGGGVLIEEGGGNQIFGNNVTNNMCSFNLYGTSGNAIFENNITGGKRYGFWFLGSSNNTIYHNNIANNKNQAGWSTWYDISANSWDIKGEGNFWSNYNGTDANSDGIGDTPYFIAENNTDHYPLIAPYQKTQPTTTPKPSPTPTITPTPTAAPTTTPTTAPTPTPTSMPTATPTQIPAPNPTATPTPPQTPALTTTATPTQNPTPNPTQTTTPTTTPTNSPQTNTQWIIVATIIVAIAAVSAAILLKQKKATTKT